MPKTNSESDFGGSLTSDDSDIEAGPSSPVHASRQSGEAFKLPSSTPKLNLDTDSHANTTTSNHYATASPIRGDAISPTKSTASRPTRFSLANVEEYGPKLRGVALFRASVRKIMQMQQFSALMGVQRGVGAEPGVDPRRASAIATYGHLRENCAIQIVDYSSLRSKFYKFDNKGFIDFLEEKGPSKESWAKVRWISIGGTSWDVLSTMALTYDLHPLSLEDVLHQRDHIRSKADYFVKHLFLRVLCHSLGSSSVKANEHITTLPRSASPIGIRTESRFSDDKFEYDAGDDDNDDSEKSQTRLFRKKTRKASPGHSDLEAADKRNVSTWPRIKRHSNAQQKATLDTLKADARVNVLLKNLYIFLLRDGTVISIHQTPSPAFAEPILTRLRASDTVLRSTADPSLLVQSILDLVVDQAVEVVEEYQKEIFKLECEVLLKPKMKTVRHLHILSGDLTLHKRTLGPLKSLIYGLRRYDLDRCIAIAEASAEDDAAGAGVASAKVVGYMSHKSKVYLADVHDHVEYILSSLDMFAGVSENLINYTFNMAGYEMNQVMRRLTLATIICLPLTFLSGYFGMNFQHQWSVHHNSDVLFWEIALPAMVVVITLFMWSDFISLKHFLEKKIVIRQSRRS
ncbi:hypothetical protein K439DRAFT_1082558 [Ramaria rubella]|nr:hypothetical protein K439DRAFT_1082558 [Ramaria rubella]